MSPFEILGTCSITPAEIESFNSLDRNAPVEYRELAVLLASRWQRTGSPIIGIGGGQGTGKSTLCSLVEHASRICGDTIAILCLDDFYLTKSERIALAKSIHPSLQTRGPPGTHDVDRLMDTVENLSQGRPVTVPVFDKGLDDRVGVRSVDAGTARVVIEGWCVGAAAEPVDRLNNPINRLERQEDAGGKCRTWINDQLAGPYRRLTTMLNELVFIRTVNMEHVRKWRLRQEQERPRHLRMDKASIHKFIEHYERITMWMLEDLVCKADVVVTLDERHEISALSGFEQRQ